MYDDFRSGSRNVSHCHHRGGGPGGGGGGRQGGCPPQTKIWGSTPPFWCRKYRLVWQNIQTRDRFIRIALGEIVCCRTFFEQLQHHSMLFLKTPLCFCRRGSLSNHDGNTKESVTLSLTSRYFKLLRDN